jgi:hypothetical protein
MTRVDLSKFKKQMESVLKEIQKPQTMKEIGEFARDRIVKRTRLGKGVSDRGAEAQPLDPLKEDYRARRKRLKKDGRLSPKTTPSKSNLTATGQMLDSVTVKASDGKALIQVTGTRKEGGSNKDVAGYVSEKRPFLNISKAELNGLNRFIRETFEKVLNKIK